MKTISQAFNVDKSFTLAETASPVTAAKPKTTKTTPKNPRVALSELELTYLHDATLFNSINKIVQTIMSARHNIFAQDKKIQTYFKEFTSNLGSSGSLITWEGLLTTIFKFQCIYGRSWVENILNKQGNTIVDWDSVDPKTMDYAKDSMKRIVMDKFGNPTGYVQKIPYDHYFDQQFITRSRLKAPAKVVLEPNEIFIERERIAHTKLFTVGDGFYGIGLLEPIYNMSIRKANVEEALANAIWRHGFPIIWAQLGDLQHEPSPQQIQTMLDKLKNLHFKKEIATPYYYQLHMLESKQSSKMQAHLDYFQNQQVTGLGIPKPYATGLGEATNRATLSNMSDLFQLTLKDIIQNTTESIRQQMFKPICNMEGFKEVPTIIWDMVGIDERDRKSKRIVEYVKAGVLDVDPGLQDYVKDIEELSN